MLVQVLCPVGAEVVCRGVSSPFEMLERLNKSALLDLRLNVAGGAWQPVTALLKTQVISSTKSTHGGVWQYSRRAM